MFYTEPPYARLFFFFLDKSPYTRLKRCTNEKRTRRLTKKHTRCKWNLWSLPFFSEPSRPPTLAAATLRNHHHQLWTLQFLKINKKNSSLSTNLFSKPIIPKWATLSFTTISPVWMNCKTPLIYVHVYILDFWSSCWWRGCTKLHKI